MTLSAIFLIWVIGFGSLLLLIRKRAIFYHLTQNVPLPVFFTYLLIALPVVIVEEALTCGAFPSCLLVTIPMFAIHLSLFYPLIRYTTLSQNTLIALYGMWGTFHEFITSGKLALFAPEGLLVLIIMIVLNTLIYAVVGILPIAYTTHIQDKRLHSS